MKKRIIYAALLAGAILVSIPNANAQQPAMTPITLIGGEPVITLTRPQLAETDNSQPQFLSATILPGKGMNILQIKAYIPGKGIIDLINSPDLSAAKKLLDNKKDAQGNANFSIGGAILLPYANRIRGELSADGRTLTTVINGEKVSLPANWQGNKVGAEKHAIHGLIYNSKFTDIQIKENPLAATVSGVLHAGDFDGHWLSQTDVSVKTTLKDNLLDLVITAKNVGQQPLPMGIGWHPYFIFPSNDRSQVRLRLPIENRALTNNYDDVFPTGKLTPVKDTAFDFTEATGRELHDLYLDDGFTVKHDSDGSATAEIIDPLAHYGLRIVMLSPQINALQVYAPLDKNFVAIEPQFNLADPYSKVWGTHSTGMVLLQPGAAVSWHVRLELFKPNAS